MTIPILPADVDADELAVVSRCIAHWRAEDFVTNLVTGQAGVFSRGATATIVDSLGVSFTAPNAMPRFEPGDWLGSGNRTHLFLLMGTADRLSWAAEWRPGALAFWLEFIEAGGVSIANGALLSVTNDANTGARLIVDSSGTAYRVRHNNGTNPEVSQALTVAPTIGQRVVLYGYLYGDGSVQCWQSLNEGVATSTARSAAPAAGLASSWASGARLRLNSAGTGNGSANRYRRAKLCPSVPDFATLSRLF